MHVIAKRKVLFQEWSPGEHGEVEGRKVWIPGKVMRSHLVEINAAPQAVPDWVGELESFRKSVEHGEMLEVVLPGPRSAVAPVAAKEAGFKTPPLDLSKMTKDELQLHALEVHGLELDDKLKKDEIIAAIKDKQKEESASA